MAFSKLWFFRFFPALGIAVVLLYSCNNCDAGHSIKLCIEPDSNGKCTEDQHWFEPATYEIHAILKCCLKNPERQMNLLWYFNDPEGKRYLIHKESFSIEASSGLLFRGNFEKQFKLARVGDKWSTGIYEIELGREEDHLPILKKQFMIL